MNKNSVKNDIYISKNNEKLLKVPKLGFVRLSQKIRYKDYNLKKVTISKSSTNKYYISILVDDNDNIYTKLLSVFDEDILDSTDIVHQWSGINSRGTAQFNGNVIKNLVIDNSKSNKINLDKSKSFLSSLISR